MNKSARLLMNDNLQRMANLLTEMEKTAERVDAVPYSNIEEFYRILSSYKTITVCLRDRVEIILDDCIKLMGEENE